MADVFEVVRRNANYGDKIGAMKLAALVPMRHHSQRVPGKNYRPLAGKPLYQHIIETLLAVPEIETVMVDTDSEPAKGGCAACSDDEIKSAVDYMIK